MLLAVARSNQTEQSPEVMAIQTGLKRLKGELGVLAGNGPGGEGIPSVGNVPGVGLDYSRKLREFKTQEAIFEQLTKQYELAKLNEAKDSTSFQILDEAVVPIRKSKPSRVIIVLLTAFTAFFISLLVVFALEQLDRMSVKDKKMLDEMKKLF